MTDLHLVSWNRPEMTELVIRTIRNNTEPGTYRLVVVDNGSEQEATERLESLSDKGLIDQLILLPDNFGLEAARQYMLQKHTSSEYFVCIDNDCLPPVEFEGQDWLSRMIKLMEIYDDFAAISMRTQVMIGTGNIFTEADAVGDDIVEFPHPGGSFRIMRTQVVNDVGGWARGAEGRGAEERYICGKLHEAGWRTAFAAKIQCLHLFGNRQKTTERWGYKEGMKPEDTGHSDISHPALTNGDDFACVAAYTGVKLAKEYFNANSDN